MKRRLLFALLVVAVLLLALVGFAIKPSIRRSSIR